MRAADTVYLRSINLETQKKKIKNKEQKKSVIAGSACHPPVSLSIIGLQTGPVSQWAVFE